MKLKVIKPFVDKNTSELYKTGQEVEFTKTRAEEILARVPDYVEPITEAKEEPKEAPKVKKTTKKKKEA